MKSSLKHPNVVRVHDFKLDEDTGEAYIVMELLPGGSLLPRALAEAMSKVLSRLLARDP